MTNGQRLGMGAALLLFLHLDPAQAQYAIDTIHTTVGQEAITMTVAHPGLLALRA